jgi:hypothetical protein
MEHPMAKPVKYPRKLRHTLEKVAAKREERGSFDGLLRVDKVDLFETFNQSLLPRGGVAVLHTRMDEERMQMLTMIYLNSPPHPEYVRARPPWEGETGASP